MCVAIPPHGVITLVIRCSDVGIAIPESDVGKIPSRGAQKRFL
jgi:hypothetical protein